MNQEPTYSIDEFERESRHIDNLIWDALALEKTDRVLFCGYGPEAQWVKRAIAFGSAVTVIEHRDEIIAQFSKLDAKLMRGSTSVIPAKEGVFDVAIAFHYLHEVDPFFHAQVVSELARVAKRVVVVEPSPPSDPLGRRIALLYSQAKRELGQFEYYQPIDYWKKLLQAVKAEIAQSVFAFAKVPPREYLDDTVRLILDTMEVEDAPRAYLDELRAIAKRPGSQLLPQARFVLIGSAAGELPLRRYTPREESLSPSAKVAAPAAKATPANPIPVEIPAEYATVQTPTPTAPPTVPTPQPPPAFEPAPAFVPGLPFGAPQPPDVPMPGVIPAVVPDIPFGAPFAVPAPGWQWEPPEEEPGEP
ncbi:MAG: hypothetical protein M3Y21_04540 [Candidatus Eremiobacteraeota bacterium]|nr:hypothetical protein [Candidatus Eremiobacteraeota bacterium]